MLLTYRESRQFNLPHFPSSLMSYVQGKFPENYLLAKWLTSNYGLLIYYLARRTPNFPAARRRRQRDRRR